MATWLPIECMEYGVSEKCVRDWRKAKELLRRTKETKKANRGCKARWGDLEDKLEEYVLKQLAECKGVNTGKLRLKAQQIASDLGVEDFSGNPSWCFRFMRRKGLRNDSDYQLHIYKKAFEKFSSEIIIERIIDNDEILYMSKLLTVFKSYVEKVENLKASDYSLSNLKSRLQLKFPQLAFSHLSYDLNSEIVFVEDAYHLKRESTKTESSSSKSVSSGENSRETKSWSSESLPVCENSRETKETKSSTKSNPLDNDLPYFLYASAIILRNDFSKTTVYNGARPPFSFDDCQSTVCNRARPHLASDDCKLSVYNRARNPFSSDDFQLSVYNGARTPLTSDDCESTFSNGVGTSLTSVDCESTFPNGARPPISPDCKSLIPSQLYNTIAWIVGASDEQTLDNYVKVDDTVNIKLLSILQDLVQLHNQHTGNTLQH